MKVAFVLIISLLFSNQIILAQAKAGRVDTTKNATFFVCLKHPTMTSKEPSTCSICGTAMTSSSKEKLKKHVTKSYSCPVHPAVVSHDAGNCPKCGAKLNLSSKEQMKAEVMKIYTCPMHPKVALDKDGNCPKCGRPLVHKKGS